MDSNATTTINVRTINATAKCDSILTPLKFWGATIVVFANIFYLVPYLVVVIFYLAFSELRHRIYDKAVFCFNACQLVIVVILSSMGYFVLCHKPMNSASYIISGLLLMFMTISSVFWLFLICFEMTLVITRFRWIPSDNTKNEEEKRKYLLYSALIWGGALIPTAIAGFFELAPFIPQNSSLKPNFERFNDGANISVIVYVITFPIITCIMNNVLFAYATYKVITIQKSTSIANEKRTKNAKKKYFIFLRLYLVMDAPWIIGILAAVFTDLWVLKFCRMVQPIFMLLAMLPKKRLLYATGRIRQSLRITKTNTTNTNQGTTRFRSATILIPQ